MQTHGDVMPQAANCWLFASVLGFGCAARWIIWPVRDAAAPRGLGPGKAQFREPG
jgi:hypothetical protein